MAWLLHAWAAAHLIITRFAPLDSIGPRPYARHMLVERASRYQDAVEAVFAEARTRPLVTSLMIEGMPVLGYALVLANRAGMTDSELSHRLAAGGLENMAELAKASGDEYERFAALWILKWLDEPVLEERAHNTIVVESARLLLVRPL